MPSTPISDLLHSITASLDLDHATTFADVINLYTSAIRRNSGRSILSPDDALRILGILAHILAGCDGEADPELIPGAPVRRTAVERTEDALAHDA